MNKIFVLALAMFTTTAFADAYKFPGMVGKIHNFTKIPTKDLYVNVRVSWPGLIGGSDKVVNLTTKLKKDGSYAMNARSVRCLLCLLPGEGDVSIQSSKDKNFFIFPNDSLMYTKPADLTLFELKTSTVKFQTMDGRTIEEWMKSPDSPQFLDHSITYMDAETKEVLATTKANWEQSQTSQASFHSQLFSKIGKIEAGRKIILKFKTIGKRVVLFEKDVIKTFPDLAIPEELSVISLDQSAQNFDISGVYTRGTFTGFKIVEANFQCENGQLRGRMALSDTQIFDFQGSCSFGKASFPLNITVVDSRGWQKTFKGTANLKVFNGVTSGEIIDDEGNWLADMSLGQN